MMKRSNYHIQLRGAKTFPGRRRFQKLLNLSLELLPAPPPRSRPALVTIHLCSNAQIQRLNAHHRNKNKVTDVLSFPVHENLKSERHILPGPLLLGEIYIALAVARRQAKEFELTLAEELFHLFVHGLLHLWGYDHELSAKEEKIMFSLEEKIVKKVSQRYQKSKP